MSVFWDCGLFQLKDQDDEEQLGAWRCRADGPEWSDAQVDAYLKLEYHRALRDDFERDVWAEREAYQRVAQVYHRGEDTSMPGWIAFLDDDDELSLSELGDVRRGG